jgi:hypothetical protein
MSSGTIAVPAAGTKYTPLLPPLSAAAPPRPAALAPPLARLR